MTWYSTGTVKTTANSAVVIGTGTAWTNSGLRSGDMLLIGYSTISPRGYEIKSIDSATQITLVLPFPVAVNGGSYVGIPMLSGDRTAITMTLANQVTKALADTEAMSAVYQTFYTSTGTVNLTLPGGLSITGSSFLKLTADMESKANKNEVFLKSGGSVDGYLSASGNITKRGFLDSSRPTGANSNDVIIAAHLNPSAGGYANTITYQWYADGWLTGSKRGGAFNTIGFGVYYNGASTGSSREWIFNTDGSASAQGAWVNGSDERHKSKIKEVENPLSAVCSWRGCSYEMKDGGEAVGLIAQDVEKFCPVAIKTYGDREFSDKTVINDFKYLDTTGVSAAYHTGAIKQLFALLELALEDPDACRAQIEAVKLAMIDVSQAEQAS